MPTDYYELLGVRKDASDEDLKRAYRSLARELHPDANGGDAGSEARFKEVSLAYETLRDPERRRRYDMFGPEAVRGSGAGGGGGAADFGFGANIGDIFDAFFGGGGGGGGGGGFGSPNRGSVRRGSDAEVIVDLTLAEAVFGATRDVTVRLPVPCEACSGSGARPGTSPTSCPDCRGSGQVQRVRQSFLGQMVTASPCGRCEGSGEIVSSPCLECHGQGRVQENKTLGVQVPAGVDDGSTLRVQGGGAAALRGGQAGDLYVHLRVKPDPRFERAGADLVSTVHISFAQATLGTSLDFETLDGTSEIHVPAGTQSGKVIRLPGLGVTRLRGRGRGDILVQLAVDTPTKLSEEEEYLVRRLAELRDEKVAEPEQGFFHWLRSKVN